VKRREEANMVAKKDESTVGLGWYAGKVDGDNLLFFLFVSIMLVWSVFEKKKNLGLLCWWYLVESNRRKRKGGLVRKMS